MIKLLNFHFSASNSVAVSWLGIGFQAILKKWSKKKITYPTFNYLDHMSPNVTIRSQERINIVFFFFNTMERDSVSLIKIE